MHGSRALRTPPGKVLPVMPAALLLDLDGTLLDTEPLHFEAHRRFLASVGIVPTHDDLVGNVGRGDREFYLALMARSGVTGDAAAWVEAKTGVLRGLYAATRVALRPGAEALLAAASSRGIPGVVVTSSGRQLAAAALASAGLDRRLPMRVCREDTARHKPAPDPFLLAAARLGLPPAACLAVEDSDSGVASAVAAGCAVVAVPGHIPAERLRGAGAQRILPSLDGIL